MVHHVVQPMVLIFGGGLSVVFGIDGGRVLSTNDKIVDVIVACRDEGLLRGNNDNMMGYDDGSELVISDRKVDGNGVGGTLNELLVG